jgi:hypothetical protein
LKKEHTGRPYTWGAAIPGQNEASDNGLYLKHQECACENGDGKWEHMKFSEKSTALVGFADKLQRI